MNTFEKIKANLRPMTYGETQSLRYIEEDQCFSFNTGEYYLTTISGLNWILFTKPGINNFKIIDNKEIYEELINTPPEEVEMFFEELTLLEV